MDVLHLTSSQQREKISGKKFLSFVFLLKRVERKDSLPKVSLLELFPDVHLLSFQTKSFKNFLKIIHNQIIILLICKEEIKYRIVRMVKT